MVLGEYDLGMVEAEEKPRTITQIHMHPNYQHLTRDNDVALIKLKHMVVFNEWIKSLHLPDANNYCGFLPPDKSSLKGRTGICRLATVTRVGN